MDGNHRRRVWCEKLPLHPKVDYIQRTTLLEVFCSSSIAEICQFRFIIHERHSFYLFITAHNVQA